MGVREKLSEGFREIKTRLSETPIAKQARLDARRDRILTTYVLSRIKPDEFSCANTREYKELLQLVEWTLAERSTDYPMNDLLLKALARRIVERGSKELQGRRNEPQTPPHTS